MAYHIAFMGMKALQERVTGTYEKMAWTTSTMFNMLSKSGSNLPHQVLGLMLFILTGSAKVSFCRLRTRT